MIKNIEDETLGNIENHIEEQDMKIKELIEVNNYLLGTIEVISECSEHTLCKCCKDAVDNAINKTKGIKADVENKQSEREFCGNWCLQDIEEQAKGNGHELTEQEIIDVADWCENKFDCDIGMNWDVMDMWIDKVIEEREV